MSTQHLSSRFHVSLPTRSIFAVPDGAGVGIECRSGSVWVTLDHDPRDIVLAPGERFEGTDHRRVLVSALESSCITISDAQPAAMPLPTRASRRSPWRLPSLGLSPA
ncbi:DUF2917 domain-containing protein [Variovorax paradoxus]|uniref:DUF2917 domain-containing protein n=1 Tax=Variovorax paradoxus TaxID=34073 RepID=A0A6I6HBV1_VARPD|nr:DUF2917 domain-containing protein [Variovorax paradoxus]QGW80521.1 DUF2917 domain-containing protein [Variovorax paradoxus]